MEKINGLNRVVAVTGHYGCGKTNFAINLALNIQAGGEEITIVDLDIVNPYFVTSDYRDMLVSNGIDVITSKYASSQSEAPSLPREISAVIRGNKRVVIDIGGDDVGARALGRFHEDIKESSSFSLIYLFSVFRPQTRTVADTAEHIRQIELTSRQKVDFLINSSNLASDTKIHHVEQSEGFAKKLAEYTKIPLLATLSLEAVSKEGYFQIKRFVKLPWETD